MSVRSFIHELLQIVSCFLVSSFGFLLFAFSILNRALVKENHPHIDKGIYISRICCQNLLVFSLGLIQSPSIKEHLGHITFGLSFLCGIGLRCNVLLVSGDTRISLGWIHFGHNKSHGFCACNQRKILVRLCIIGLCWIAWGCGRRRLCL